MQAYMVGPNGVLRKALFSRGVAARLVAVRGLLYMTVQQLRTMDESPDADSMEADPELSLSQVFLCVVVLYRFLQTVSIMHAHDRAAAQGHRVQSRAKTAWVADLESG